MRSSGGRFRAGHASAANWRDAVASILAQLGPAPLPAGPGFVYITDRFAGEAPAIVDALRASTHVLDWTGSVGIGVLGSTERAAAEYVEEPAIAVLIADWPDGEYRVFSGRARPPGPNQKSASGARAAHFAIVHGDPNTPDMPELIQDMARKIESGFLVGGLSSAEGRTQQIANEVISGGLSGIVVSSDVTFSTRLTQGCTPLARRYIVTAGEGNVIATLDGMPALDLFRDAATAQFGTEVGADLRRAAAHLLVGLPVPGSDRGDYLVRNIMGIDPRAKQIAIGAPIEVGMQLTFCLRDGDAARRDLDRMLDELLADMKVPPRGALYFSCLGRGEHMFGARSVEIGLIRDRLGAVPVAGFFCNGEISHDRLYGYTGVLALFT
jgi:small ligand-binding sensory domain FIST